MSVPRLHKEPEQLPVAQENMEDYFNIELKLLMGMIEVWFVMMFWSAKVLFSPSACQLGLAHPVSCTGERWSLPPHHIINSHLTRTICVQSRPERPRHSGSGGGGRGGEECRGRRRDLCSWLTKSASPPTSPTHPRPPPPSRQRPA